LSPVLKLRYHTFSRYVAHTYVESSKSGDMYDIIFQSAIV